VNDEIVVPSRPLEKRAASRGTRTAACSMFGRIVRDIDPHRFESSWTGGRRRRRAGGTRTSRRDAPVIVGEFKAVFANEGKNSARPEGPLEEAIAAVFRSWTEAAVALPQLRQDPHDLGTAANVQMMCFGNLGDDSGTGVVFTRNPATGEKAL